VIGDVEVGRRRNTMQVQMWHKHQDEECSLQELRKRLVQGGYGAGHTFVELRKKNKWHVK
jgi:hypothetical protein